MLNEKRSSLFGQQRKLKVYDFRELTKSDLLHD